jgi:site-specific recombinase XerD
VSKTHFNSSPSAVEKWCSNSIVKAKIHLTLTFAMTNGDGHSQNWQTKPIMVSIENVETVYAYAYNKYEKEPSKLNLRNFLIIRLPRKVGLRNSEIRTLTVELVNFSRRIIMVLDSKKHVLFPLPIDLLTLHFIKDLVNPRRKGYIFIHEGTWTKIKADNPLTKMQVWNIVHNIAVEAGVEGFNPRDLRRAFAYEWYRKMRSGQSKKTLKGLQAMMRHNELRTTGIYVDKMFCFEDLQEEFDDEGYRFKQTTKEELKKIG